MRSTLPAALLLASLPALLSCSGGPVIKGIAAPDPVLSTATVPPGAFDPSAGVGRSPTGATIRFVNPFAPETLRKTNLGTYDPSSQNKKFKVVNLERASEIGGRTSGHFVQGHVDNVGRIIDQWIDDNSLFFKVTFPSEYMRYIVPKGFIAIDGTSLTVCDVNTGNTPEDNWFTFMLVEYTQKKIILPFKGVGDTVNVEVDVLGKYSERAWEAFVPKMQELEMKVRELEGRLRHLEEREDGGDGKGSTGDDFGISKTEESKSVTFGDIIPQSPERKNSEPDGDEIDGMTSKTQRTVSDTQWVRSQQTFLGKNY
jgi:riboflavin synthase alpha subunit